jgi:hypothetical protein
VTDAEHVPGQLRAAVVVIWLQALGLLAVAVLVIVKTAFGDPDSLGRALLGAALAVLGMIVLLLCARGLLALRPAARTPVVVIELLALPVGYSLGFQAGLIGYGGPILFTALVVLFLLFTPPVRAVLDRTIEH